MDQIRLEQALRAAHAAGDTAAASRIAQALRGGGTEISQGSPGGIPINMAREGSLGARALAGIPITPEGSARALEGAYGRGNVMTSPAGEVFLREGGEVYPLNRPGFSMGDVAGMSGAAIETLPALAATGVGGAALGAGAGNLLRQGIAAGLGERAGMGQRAMSAGTAAAVGGATQGVVNAGARVLNALRPSTVAATALSATAGRSRFAAEVAKSESIEEVLGIALTPGQRTQSKSLLTLEGMLRRNPASADIILQNDEAQLAQASRALRNVLERIRPGEAPTEGVGNTVKHAFDTTLDRALQLRRSQAGIDFAKVDNLSGGVPLINPEGLRSEIQLITDELDVPGGGDATSTLVGKLKTMASQLGDGRLTAAQYQRLLQIYGQAARGKGKLFQDLDTAQQRWVAGRVQRALQGDLDTAIAGGGLPGDVAAALATARQNYAANSQAVAELGKSTLGRMLNDRTGEFSPARLVDALEHMRPDQLKRVFGILDGASPDEAQLVKRGLMERVIERAQPPTEVLAQRLEGGQPLGEGISPARLLTEMRRSPVWAVLDGQERFMANQIVQGMQRLANRAGTEGSPTMPLLAAWDFAKALGGSLAGLDPIGALRLSAGILAPRQLAQTIVSPQGQQAWATTLRELSRPRGRATRALTSSLMFLAGRGTMEAFAPEENVRPDAGLASALGANAAAAPQNLLRSQP